MSQKKTNAGSSGGETTPRPLNNLFQKTGNEKAYELMETKKAFMVRVDMPGCRQSDLTFRVDDRNAYFVAVEPSKPDYKYIGRKYEGALVINPEAYDVKEAQAKIVNGVLWFTMPKIPGSKAFGDGPEKVMHLHFAKPNAA